MLAEMGAAAAGAVPELLSMTRTETGTNGAEACHCLSHIVKPETNEALELIDGLVVNVRNRSESRNVDDVRHDLCFIASMPFDDKRIFELVNRGTQYRQDPVAHRACILALGKGSRWAPAAIEVLDALLLRGNEDDVGAALDALAMREDDLGFTFPALIKIVTAPAGLINGPSGYMRDVVVPGTDGRHARAITILERHGVTLAPLYVDTLRAHAAILVGAADRMRELARDSPMSVDKEPTFEERAVWVEQGARMIASREACRRVANLLRRLGDHGARELSTLESLPIPTLQMSRDPQVGLPTASEMWTDALRNAAPPR